MKKYLVPLTIGFLLILVGVAYFYTETVNYDISMDLASNFNMKQKILEYEISDSEIFKITNNEIDKNMNLYINNNLTNEVRIVVEYSDLLMINTDYDTRYRKNEKVINLDIESELILDFNSIDSLYKLGLETLRNKTIYNYSLLGYPKVRVYVNEKYKENVEFVNKYGKAYNQIR
ncbi:MAG: hypothetical protein IJO43_00130 [Bacilli bacterium]|nr:hypothetical protein [Bacilli bacterium]